MNPAADIWAKVLALMQNEMTTTTINTWFDDTTAVELEGDRFVLYSPTPFKRDIIASRYLPAIQNADGEKIENPQQKMNPANRRMSSKQSCGQQIDRRTRGINQNLFVIR